MFMGEAYRPYRLRYNCIMMVLSWQSYCLNIFLSANQQCDNNVNPKEQQTTNTQHKRSSIKLF
ncbi:MAG: hypothetical protein LBH59_06540 [Planctomycetaceae bacterium]|nr:hypothetical protein [Planctomycetaceae bacterium]